MTVRGQGSVWLARTGLWAFGMPRCIPAVLAHSSGGPRHAKVYSGLFHGLVV